MRPMMSGVLGALPAILFSSVVMAEDPYLPFNKNGTLIVPEATPGPGLSPSASPSAGPSPTTVNSHPTYELGPSLGVPPRSTIPVPSEPTPAQAVPSQPTPSQSNRPTTPTYQNSPAQPTPEGLATPPATAPSQFAPTVVTPGSSGYLMEPQPYSTGYRGRGLWDVFWAPSWTQQTNYGPYYGGGMGGSPCQTCPTPMMSPNFEFGRGYDGFMTGW